MTTETINNDWTFHGMEVSKEMHEDVLDFVRERYLNWQTNGCSWELEHQVMGPPRCIAVDQVSCETVGEFLGERLNHYERDMVRAWESDVLWEFIRDLLNSQWEIQLDQVRTQDEDADPVEDARLSIEEWLSPMRLTELTNK